MSASLDSICGSLSLLRKRYAYLTTPVNLQIAPWTLLSVPLENRTRDFQSRCRYLIFAARARYKTSGSLHSLFLFHVVALSSSFVSIFFSIISRRSCIFYQKLKNSAFGNPIHFFVISKENKSLRQLILMSAINLDLNFFQIKTIGVSIINMYISNHICYYE